MIRKIIQNLIVLLSILSFFGIYGCAVAVIGIGAAGAGAFAYFNGKLTRTYESEYHDTVRASSDTLERLKIPVTETIADELKTEIKAKRTDDTPVAIEVLRIDRDHTQVSVRTGSVGVWDRKVSEQIHGYINQALSQNISNDEKSAEALVTEAVDRAVGESAQKEIMEEDLAESVSKPVHVAAPTHQMPLDPTFVIFFEQNSNELTDTAIEKLNQVYDILTNNPAFKIKLNGHSDSIGAPSYNLMISEIRANAVKSYLIGKGIKSTRMMVLGHGPNKSIASNKSAEGRRLNRRVEIELITP